jgi:L-alanine-DL-glutamate epimerase-like enolase superfamily enzyme
MNCQVLEASVEFFHQPFLVPLRLSSGSISEITEARAEVRVRVGNREATGRGSIYLSDLWAWPEPTLSHNERDRILRAFCERLAADLPAQCGGESAHPLELGLRLHHAAGELPVPENPTLLAREMAASPFDAAIHDAVGHALQRTAFSLYQEDAPIPSGDSLFQAGSACAAIRHILRSEPLRQLPAWIIVGPNDDLAGSVSPWIRERGYHCFKLKILGNPAEDAAFTARVFQAVRTMGAARPRLCADPNGAYSGPEQAVEYLDRVHALDAEAFEAFEYLEQPTGREITGSSHNWREPARRKPILLDEGLTGAERMEEAVAQGWSGFALKTCKGHSFALLAAAWAKERGLMITLQDLTNPGFSLIHGALFAAYVPTLNGAELNSPQFTPSANEEWLPRLSSLFEPRDGYHHLPSPLPIGLGSSL